MVEQSNKNLIPISIVIAGLIVAGSVIYVNQDKDKGGAGQPNGSLPVGTELVQQFSDCLDSGKFADEVKKDYQEGQTVGVSGTPAFFINGEKISGALPFSSFQQIIENKLQEGFQGSDIPIENEPILGDPSAPVTMIEFSDFECPYCARHASQTFPQIKEEYVDTGRVKVIFKNFPLPFHSDAQKAAEAGECALEQGKFWEYKEKLFEKQQALSITDLKEYAKELGLD